MFKLNSLKNNLRVLVECAKILGLPEKDIQFASEMIDHREFGLCFEIVIEQMHEYGIEIDGQVYDLIVKTGKKMKFLEDNYSYMKELVNENNLSQPVKDELTKIINKTK